MKCCGYCVKIFTSDKYKFCPYCGGKAKDYTKGSWRKEVEKNNTESFTVKNSPVTPNKLEMPIHAKCPDCEFKYMNVWKTTGIIYCGNCLKEGNINEDKYKHLKE